MATFLSPLKWAFGQKHKGRRRRKREQIKEECHSKNLKRYIHMDSDASKNRTKVIFDKFFDFFHVVPKLPIGKIIY